MTIGDNTGPETGEHKITRHDYPGICTEVQWFPGDSHDERDDLRGRMFFIIDPGTQSAEEVAQQIRSDLVTKDIQCKVILPDSDSLQGKVGVHIMEASIQNMLPDNQNLSYAIVDSVNGEPKFFYYDTTDEENPKCGFLTGESPQAMFRAN